MTQQKKAKKAVKKASANTTTNEFILDNFQTIQHVNEEIESIHNYIEKEYKKLNKLYATKFIPFTNALISDIQINKSYYSNDSKAVENLLSKWYLIWLRYTTNIDFLLDGFNEGCHRDFYRYKVDVDKSTLISFTAEERQYISTMELSASSVYFISNSYNQRDIYFPHLYCSEHNEKGLKAQKNLHLNNELKANNLASKLDNLRLCLLQQEPLKSLKNCLSKSLNIRFDNDFGDRKRTINFYGLLKMTLKPSTIVHHNAKMISEGEIIKIPLHDKVEEYSETCEKKQRLFKGLLILILLLNIRR
jgi:hypothetical protein